MTVPGWALNHPWVLAAQLWVGLGGKGGKGGSQLLCMWKHSPENLFIEQGEVFPLR